MAGADMNAASAGPGGLAGCRSVRDDGGGAADQGGGDDRAQCVAIRLLLYRKILAAYRYRTAVARRMGISESELAALIHLTEGAMTPGELGRRLQLTSGGMTSLLQRLDGAGRIARRPHPTDRRSTLISARPDVLEHVAEFYAPLVADTHELTGELSARDRKILRGYLERVVAFSERRADELVAEQDADELTPPDDALYLWA